MNDRILIEQLSRIHQMMGVSNNILIFEQDGIEHRLNAEMRGKKTTEPHPDSITYPTYNLGPEAIKSEMEKEGPYYVGFNTTPTKIMGPKDGSGPKVWTLNSGSKIEDILDASKYGGVKYGPVTDKLAKVHENQPYIESDGNKFCLPTKEWFDVYTQYNPVYKFQSPLTGKQYAVELIQREEELPTGPQGERINGKEASIACYGGDNGWKFQDKNIREKKEVRQGARKFEAASYSPYREVGGTEYWDITNIEMFDTRSNDDIFWDTYGVWIEVGVGLLVGFVSGPIGAYLGLARWGIVAFEIVAELSALTPKIYNAWKRGNRVDAAVTGLFCFLPIFMEWAPAHKWLSNGIRPKNFGKADVASLLEKVNAQGGFSRIYSKDYLSETNMYIKGFYDSLTKAEQEVLDAGTQMIKNIDEVGESGGENMAKLIDDIFSKNGEKVQKIVDQKKFGKAEKLADNMARVIVNQGSVLYGKGFISQLGRGVIMIGPIAFGLTEIGNYISSKFPTMAEEEKEKLISLIKKYLGLTPDGRVIGSDEVVDEKLRSLNLQIIAMAELYDQLGWLETWGLYMNESLQESIDEMAESGDILNTEVAKEIVTKAEEKAIARANADYEKALKTAVETSGGATVKLANAYEVFFKKSLIDTIFKDELGINPETVTLTSDANDFNTPWDIKVVNQDGQEQTGQIVFTPKDDDYSIKIMLDGNEVYPSKTQQKTQKPKTGTFCKKSRGGDWVKVDEDDYNRITNPNEKCYRQTETTCDLCPK